MNLEQEFEELIEHAEQQVQLAAQHHQLEKSLIKSMPKQFEKNIQAFIKYLPDIAEEFRHYKPKNLNLFCSKSGELNIIDNATKSPLYGHEPSKQCEKQVEKVLKKPQFSSLEFGMNEGLDDEFIHTTYVRQMYQVYLDAKQKYEKLTEAPDHIGSSIIFGIGLGYHLKPLLDAVTIDHIYLCEPDRDLFFASLYSCDWASILEIIDERDGNIVLNIGVTYEKFTVDFINEMKHRGAFNSVATLLYQHYPSEALTQLIKQFHKDFHMVAIGWGFYDDGVISIAHDYNNAKQRLPTLRKDAKLATKWRSMPVFIVGNGPSLDETMPSILEYRDKAVIISCGSALLPLLKHNIIPDFHVALERTRFTFDYYNEFIDHEILQQINFLTVNVMHPECASLFKWTGMAFKAAEPGTTISCEFIDGYKQFRPMKYCNPVVANTALAFACNMGCEEIYLMGVDGGYKDPKYHHSKSSSYFNDDGSDKEDLSKLIRAGEMQTEGNFTDVVYTTAFFSVGNDQLGTLLRDFPQVNCFNCSDGAKIKNSTPLRHDDILLSSHLADKNEFIEVLKNEQFIQREFDENEYQNWVAIDKFSQVCDDLIKFVDRDFESRSEIAIALKLQVRYLYSYGNTRYRHLYFLLDGSITYIHSIFRMIQYSFAKDEDVLKIMSEAFEIFIEYMTEAKKKYRGVLTANDSQRSYLMNMLDSKK
ncbi:6-hydroxymethylpterin diphosphokinase MptE-like protein [Pseudoalteromonas phenolica]|uniref:motility associated factor glycosyltransferase family protein n=1 Tax=Pseudoalteromonas phenolica TaxID=161398 RepID=UPI00384EA2A3